MTQSLKILHILDHSLPLHSGYTFRSQNIFRSQIKRGWQPIVVTSPKHESGLKTDHAPDETLDGIPYYRSGASHYSALPFVTERRLMHRLAARIEEIALKEKPDVLHAHSPVLTAFPALKVGKKLGLPVIYDIRAFWEDAAVDHGTYKEGSWKYRLTRYMETRACRQADQVAILCQGLKDDLINRGISKDKIHIVGNGVNIEDFNQNDPDLAFQKQWGLNNKKIIGFIGSFYRYEGLDILIEAFAKIAQQQTDAMLLLVGGGPVESELKKQIEKLGIGDRVVMPGRLPHQQVPGLYALCDVLVYARYANRLTELVTPLKPLEAMAMGKALIASNIGGHRTLITHDETGLLFEPENSDNLAKALDQVLTDDAYRLRLEQTGQAWVRENRTWDKTTAVYIELYDKALAGHKA
ncbi:MAG TPA: glycosyltransferase, exosortase A system-associated [Acidiferrobacteraceae bacterium]|nr:glycosyltransferase, exosortase A system-associated [Acidiferrobacteraceae bacterium]HEX20385.1 glycosyltransferase, exosortase A system-associated [Acidiferrobacteraceae bacterium]